jgi:hypothetical protein
MGLITETGQMRTGDRYFRRVTGKHLAVILLILSPMVVVVVVSVEVFLKVIRVASALTRVLVTEAMAPAGGPGADGEVTITY